MTRTAPRALPRLLLGAATVCAAALPSPRAAADPPAGARTSANATGRRDAHRDSDRMRRRRRYEHTLDPISYHGRPIQVRRTTPPVAFGPAPALAPDASGVAPADGAARAQPAAARPYDHVLIVSLDGLRPDAIAMTDAPNLRLLRQQGAFALEARTITHSYTLPSHTSMLTGVDTDRHGLLHNNFTPSRGFVRVPTIFYHAHDAGLSTAMFVSKPKLRHLALPGSVDVFARPDYVCGPVVAAAAAHLANAPPGITFVHLSEPDEYGHSRGWMTEAYLRGIASADACVGTLLTALAQRHDLDRVLVIVSADHGGHGRTHGSENDVDMRIPWIAWGSRVVRGDFRTPVSTMDTAATALAALGVEVPEEMAGHPVRIALDGPTRAAPSPGLRPTSPASPGGDRVTRPTSPAPAQPAAVAVPADTATAHASSAASATSPASLTNGGAASGQTGASGAGGSHL